MSRRQFVAVLVLVAALLAAAGYLAWQRMATPAADEPTFQVIVLKPGSSYAQQLAEATEAGGKVPPEIVDFGADAFSFPLTDVKRNAAGQAFLDLMRTQPQLALAMQGAAVLRIRDGERITPDGGDALADDNLTVLVLPPDIVSIFDSERTAFQIIRMRVTGLQQ